MKTERKRRSPARKDALLRRFETAVGRSLLLEDLDWSGDERSVALAAMLADPVYRHHSFAKLCQRVGLRCHEVIDLFRQHRLAEAMVSIALRLPDVVKGIARDALDREEVCPKCEGSGKVGDRVCPACCGEGRIRKPGNPESQRLIFEAAGLIGRRRGRP